MLKPALLTSTVVGVLLALTGAAAAQTASSPPPAGGYRPIGYYPEPHDHSGFFARVYLGPAYLSSSIDTPAGTLTVSGGGAGLGLAAGAAVTANVIVYGELFADAIVGPHVELGGQSGTADDNASFSVGGLGAGVAYYTASNLFVSGTLSFSQISVDDDGSGGNDPVTTDFGPGVTLLGGKEWWIGRNTALGVAGQLFFGSQPEKNDGGTWHTTAFGVMVTASYN